MTISLRGTATGLTAAADVQTPFAAVSYTIPTGEQIGDLLITMLGAKWSTATTFNTSFAVPSTYSLLDWVAQGTTVTGNGTGSAYLQLNTKTATSAAEANPSQTFADGYSPAMLAMIAFQKTNAGAWTVESTDAIDNTATGTTFNLTGATTLNFTTGDVVMLVTCHNDDVTAESAPSITIPGCTVGTITEQLPTNATATGNDGSLWCYTATITSGTATGVPSASITTASTEADGVGIFVRISEPISTSEEYWGMIPF